MARPTFEPTADQRRLVEQLAAFGIPEADMVTLVLNKDGSSICEKTLRKHFRNELSQGQLKANVKVAQNLFNIATGNGKGAVTAAIFWLKTRAGWKEVIKVQPVGGDGETLPTFITLVAPGGKNSTD